MIPGAILAMTIKGITMEEININLPRGITISAATEAPVMMLGGRAGFRTLHAELTRELYSKIDTTQDHGPTYAGAASPLIPGRVLDANSDVWAAHAGRDRYERPLWEDSDFSLAVEAADMFSPKATELHQELVERAAELVAAEELADVVGVSSAYGVAGVLNGFVKACETVDRAFPLYWFERTDGAALYAVHPTQAALFREVYAHRGATRIWARKDARWYTEVVPGAVEILAARARAGQRIRYRELSEQVRASVPGARVPVRGKVMGWLLADISTAVHKVEPSLPLLTSIVVGADGQPSSGFAEIHRELRGEPTGDFVKTTQDACTDAYSVEVTAALVDKLRQSQAA